MSSQYNILIVDDEPHIITALRQHIEWDALDLQIIGAAHNGLDALNVIQNIPVDILITDVRMPEMNGLDLIKAAVKYNASVKCIIISAHDEFEYVKEALQYGVENYLLKPINYSELYYTLQKTLLNIEQDVIHHRPDADISYDMLAFKYNILNRWMNGTIDDFELVERSRLIDIDLSLTQYQAAILTIIDHRDAKIKFEYCTMLLNYVRDEIQSMENISLLLDIDYNIVLIMIGEVPQTTYTHIQSVVSNAIDDDEFKNVGIFLSFGSIVSSYNKLHHSYHMARLCLYYRYIYPQSSVSNHFISTHDHDALFHMHDEVIAKICKALKEENFHVTQKLVGQLIAKYLQANLTFDEIHRQTEYILIYSIHTVVLTGKLSDNLPVYFIDTLSQFYRFHDLTELKAWLLDYVGKAIKVISERKGTYHLLVRRTFDNINTKYQEQISLKTIAYTLNVTPAYLGQLFKSETGELFNDYLAKVRMEKAKELLYNSDLKINQIIHKIGISSQSYFNRLFKKMYGISPTEFKRNSQYV